MKKKNKAEVSNVTIVVILVIIAALLGLALFFSKVKDFKAILGT